MLETEMTLTVQELEAAHLASFDLGPGYPQLPVPEFVRRLYLNDTIEDLSIQFAPIWTPEKQERVDLELENAVQSFLGLGSGRFHSLRTTFSGSIALDRAVAALARSARIAGAEGIDVITTTPSIDIMRLFLEERREITPHFVRSNRDGEMGRLDSGAIIEALNKSRVDSPYSHRVVLLTTPENPTGNFWTYDQLLEIANSCGELGAVLLVDHTFVVTGVQEEAIPRIWDVAPDGTAWMAIWDTGKTFGLNEDKLGFIITSDAEMTQSIDNALAVLQFGVARRQKMFFAELIRQAQFYDHLEALRSICQKNVQYLNHAMAETILRPRSVPAGSMALVDCSELELSDEMIRKRLLQAQVGVVAGNVFFHDEWRPDNWIRIALAREPEHFERAIDCLLLSLLTPEC